LLELTTRAKNVYASMRYLHTPVCHIARSLGLPLTIKFVNYLITWRCNSRCIMCNIWKKNSSGQKELGVDEIEDIFADSFYLSWNGFSYPEESLS